MRREKIGLVLTQDEKRVLERLAEAEGGLSRAALVRRLVRRAARERGLWPGLDTPTATERKETENG